jgi:hypothetical protein
MNDQKISDYVILLNAGVGLAYIYASIMALINCIQIQGGFQTSLAVSEESFGKECAVAVIGLIFSAVVTVLNVQHARRHFCNKDAKTPIDYAASIGLAVLIGLAMTRTISNIASFNNVSPYGYKDLGGAITITAWAPLIFDAFCLILAALGLMYTIRRAEIQEKIIVRDEKIQSGEIAAEVATHAMGHPEPPEELRGHNKIPSQEMNDPLNKEKEEAEAEAKRKKEEEKKKKVPPVLSANPDNEMLGKINREKRILATETPTFADPDDALIAAAKKRQEAADEARRSEKMLRERQDGHEEQKIEESIMKLDEIDIDLADTLPVDKSDD